MWGEMSHLRFVCTTGGVVPLTAGVGLTITSRSSLRSCTSIIACRQASDTGEIQTEINGEIWGDMGRYGEITHLEVLHHRLKRPRLLRPRLITIDRALAECLFEVASVLGDELLDMCGRYESR